MGASQIAPDSLTKKCVGQFRDVSLIRNGFSKTTECQRLNCGGGVDRNEL